MLIGTKFVPLDSCTGEAFSDSIEIGAEYASLREDLDRLREVDSNVKDKTRSLEHYRFTAKHKKDLLDRKIDRMARKEAKLEKYPRKDTAVSESWSFFEARSHGSKSDSRRAERA